MDHSRQAQGPRWQHPTSSLHKYLSASGLSCYGVDLVHMQEQPESEGKILLPGVTLHQYKWELVNKGSIFTSLKGGQFWEAFCSWADPYGTSFYAHSSDLSKASWIMAFLASLFYSPHFFTQYLHTNPYLRLCFGENLNSGRSHYEIRGIWAGMVHKQRQRGGGGFR